MVLNDEELYRQITEGDRRAFAALYERRVPALFRYALHLSGSLAVAEEVTDKAFVQLIESGMRFDAQRGSVEACLYGLARKLVRAMRKQRGNVVELEIGAGGDRLD